MITLKFTDQEMQAFSFILDLALKAGGLQALGPVSVLAAKLDPVALSAACPDDPSEDHAEKTDEN